MVTCRLRWERLLAQIPLLDVAGATAAIKSRERLDSGVLTDFIWLDARDMLRDAMTRGKADRHDMVNAMNWHRFKEKVRNKLQERRLNQCRCSKAP